MKNLVSIPFESNKNFDNKLKNKKRLFKSNNEQKTKSN